MKHFYSHRKIFAHFFGELFWFFTNERDRMKVLFFESYHVFHSCLPAPDLVCFRVFNTKFQPSFVHVHIARASISHLSGR